MIKIVKKSGFSLAETIISMLLLVLVIMLTMTAITKKRTVPLNKVTISGIFACWIEDNAGAIITCQKCDGNRCITYKNDRENEEEFDSEGNPIFKMDRRGFRYHIIATGARNSCNGNKCADGQVVQGEIDAPSGADEKEMSFIIELGKTNGRPSTVIKYSDKNSNKDKEDNEGDIKALGGIKPFKSELVKGNIKYCKYVDDNNPCGTNTNGPTPVCTVGSSSITISCKKNPDETVTDDNKWMANIQDLDKSTNSIYKVEFENLADQENKKNIKVAIQLEDSSLTSACKTLEESEFTKYLKMIPTNMQNGLTDKLLKYYQTGNKMKNGVVLVMW